VLLVLIACAALAGGGLVALGRLSLDAIPDLSDTQVIVYTEMPGQAPQVVEDQVTYPLTTALLAVPRSRAVRGFSFFGVSFVYVIFEDGTDIYWARSRVLQYLASGTAKLPAGVQPALGPDATGVGWVYQYAVVGAERTLAELRSLQDWYVRFGLAKAQGVAEVASVGGFVRQYNVVVDPVKLRSYGVPLGRVVDAIRASNRETGGRVVEMAEAEFMVRGRGYLKGIDDLALIVLKADGPVPVLLRDVARIELGPDERRGASELDGEGEAVGGIALQRFGQNALEVIDHVKAKIAEIGAGLPPGVRLETVYDRSDLIHRAIATLKSTLIEESLVVAAVCIVFLLHVRSALVAIVTLPVGVLMAFLAMQALGIGSNIMSLGGIAIAIGAMIDAAIVMIENAHKHIERLPPGRSRNEAIVAAAVEVGPALFFSLLVITVSFLPIFALEEQEGRLFKPLAWTKSLAMASAALLSITLVPALMMLFVRGRILPEHRNPLNRALIALYRPVLRLVLRARLPVVGLAMLVLAASAWPAMRLGAEFMPSLDEGTLFYMPVTLPCLSITKSAELLQTQDRIIKSFPEVASVFGKAGRAATATDPAPLEMFETIINLKPKPQWRAGMTVDTLIAEMDRALQFPGIANAWTMPIKARTDMLATGIRTPVGVKLLGRDYGELEPLARQVEAAIRSVPGTTSAHAERVTGGYFLDILPRPGAARPVRRHDRGPAARGRQRIGRRERDHHRRRPRTLYGERPLPARLPVRSPRDRLGRPGADDDRRYAAARPARRGEADAGSDQHPHRERPARRLRLCRLPRPRPRALRRRRPARGAGQGRPAGRHLSRVERAVRVSRAGRGETENRRAGDAAADLRAALPQLQAHRRDADRDAVAAVRAGRRPVAGLAHGLQPERGGRGRIHRAGRRRGRDGRGDADLPRPRAGRAARAVRGRGTSLRSRRPARGDHGGRRREGAAQDDDRDGDRRRPAADPVERRHRLGGHAAHRGADDRRHGELDRADAAGHPGDLRSGEGSRGDGPAPVMHFPCNQYPACARMKSALEGRRQALRRESCRPATMNGRHGGCSPAGPHGATTQRTRDVIEDIRKLQQSIRADHDARPRIGLASCSNRHSRCASSTARSSSAGSPECIAMATATSSSSHSASTRAWERIWPGRWKASTGWARVGRQVRRQSNRALGCAPS